MDGRADGDRSRLPGAGQVVSGYFTCRRGLYCLLAPRAMRGERFRARLVDGGFPQRQLAGLPAVAGEA